MRKMTFGMFRMQCEEMYSAFKEHSTMHDLRVWDSYPGDMLKERQCWYCCVRLNDEVQMMITYDPDDEDEKPFMCWYDYPCGTINYSHWNFASMEEAMLFCTVEPHYNYRSYHHDNYCLYRDVEFKGKKECQIICSLSMLNILDYQKTLQHIPTGDWEVRRCSDVNPKGDGNVIYKIHIDSNVESDIPFLTPAGWGIPECIYE